MGEKLESLNHLNLSLSLSHTHTHMHTRTHARTHTCADNPTNAVPESSREGDVGEGMTVGGVLRQKTVRVKEIRIRKPTFVTMKHGGEQQNRHTLWYCVGTW